MNSIFREPLFNLKQRKNVDVWGVGGVLVEL